MLETTKKTSNIAKLKSEFVLVVIVVTSCLGTLGGMRTFYGNESDVKKKGSRKCHADVICFIQIREMGGTLFMFPKGSSGRQRGTCL